MMYQIQTSEAAMLKTTKLGRCHDCAQGMFAPVDSGFALYVDDDGRD